MLGDSTSRRASKSQYWFNSYTDFAEGKDFAEWWSCIGKGLRLQPAQQACLDQHCLKYPADEASLSQLQNDQITGTSLEGVKFKIALKYLRQNSAACGAFRCRSVQFPAAPCRRAARRCSALLPGCAAPCSRARSQPSDRELHTRSTGTWTGPARAFMNTSRGLQTPSLN